MEGAAEAQGECTEKGKRLRVQHGRHGQHCKNTQCQILQGRRGDSYPTGSEKSKEAHAKGVREDHGLSGKVQDSGFRHTGIQAVWKCCRGSGGEGDCKVNYIRNQKQQDTKGNTRLRKLIKIISHSVPTK